MAAATGLALWLGQGAWAQGASAQPAAVAAPAAGPVIPRSVVGEVTLAIGQSVISRDEAATIPNVQKGLDIREGDVVRTSASGHVHIRFVDGALVSVRPNSVFAVREFKFDPQRPGESVIRLSLERGEVRSVSGSGAQAARERFRLNTPLVAIGVKGTDFVTSSTAEATRVTVHQGAIVMAPFDTSCRADALGACGGQNARELTAQMAAALVYGIGGASPSLQPLPAQRESEKLQSGNDRLIRDGAERPPRVGADGLPADQVATASRLVWGRWATTPVPGDALTIGFREALAGNEVLVGDGYYFLFRSPGGPNLLPALSGGVDFKLGSSSAYYRNPGNELSAASVDSGSLRIDFSQRTYSTQLGLSAAGVGPVTAQFAGRIDPQTGIFLGQGAAGQTLGGALSLDGRQAGYRFSTPVGLGSISGATLWSR